MPDPIRIAHETLDAERALYGLRDAEISHVTFAGPADGESALKECRNIRVSDTRFELRYPLWHDENVTLTRCELTEGCRAALWYSRNVSIRGSKLMGIKVLRECSDVQLRDSTVVSPELGWRTSNVSVRDSHLEGEYAFFSSRDLRLRNVSFVGKYSFQYVENLVIDGGSFDTKDAFWHARNVVVRNATLKGEYLGWYSENLTLEHCRIEGTQPFVHCRGLKLVDCEMVGCDLAFEASEVDATVIGHVDSIRDPRSGRIRVGSVGEIVHDTLDGCGATIEEGWSPRATLSCCPCRSSKCAA